MKLESKIQEHSKNKSFKTHYFKDFSRTNYNSRTIQGIQWIQQPLVTLYLYWNIGTCCNFFSTENELYVRTLSAPHLSEYFLLFLSIIKNHAPVPIMNFTYTKAKRRVTDFIMSLSGTQEKPLPLPHSLVWSEGPCYDRQKKLSQRLKLPSPNLQ